MKEKTPENIFIATGRRKEATARVTLNTQGKGKISVNGRDYADYFPTVDSIMQTKKALIVTELEGKCDVSARVTGGGINGQAGAVSLGIARCLLTMNPQFRSVLRREDLLTRDPRAKERKKYGRKGARRRFQWTKR